MNRHEVAKVQARAVQAVAQAIHGRVRGSETWYPEARVVVTALWRDPALLAELAEASAETLEETNR